MTTASAKPSVAVCALAVRSADDKTRLIPAGTFHAPRGAMAGSGPWHLDAQGAEALIGLAASRSTDIVIDYEHQTLLAERNGLPAPAAGWVDPRSLEWRDDGLYGAVSWTAAAKAAIEGDAYRYLSPVFPYDPDSGAVLDLLHVALTNTPAIDDGAISALAAARMTTHPQEDDSVNREQLIALLGLAAEATDEQIQTAIEDLQATAKAHAKLREEMALKEEEDTGEAVAALKAKAQAKPAEPDPAKFVPKAVYDEAVAALSQAKVGQDQEMERLIDEGLKDGRIAGKATADWLKRQGLAACKAHLKDAPSLAALKGGTQTAGKSPEADKPKEGELSAAELAVCKSMGLTAEQYRQANPADDK
ncbi:phage protease [Halomonas sp.]|uniref:phage protease n=1 Tax=Halomonas sp. TaxID=1486246 RepID=UPI00298D6C28|nr:phage protease [Halomonas sp.]MDW7746579.1 phage protease [Halomonas sp.]